MTNYLTIFFVCFEDASPSEIVPVIVSSDARRYLVVEGGRRTVS
jgi:hypothetical protein